MRRCWFKMMLAGAAVAMGAGSAVVAGGAGAGAAAAVSVTQAGAWHKHAGGWHKAIQVPGLGALNKRGDARVSSVSCGSAGNCAAGGYYKDGSGHYQGFVVSEKHGHWGKAIEVPGLAALNKGGHAGVSSVSCGSAGNCAAGGYYRDRSGHTQGFVVSEKHGHWGHGHWGKAIEVPGLAALNKGGDAEVGSVSCAREAYCAAGGYYRDRSEGRHGFVVSEKHGHWGKAIEVPGLRALSKDGDAFVSSVSCAPAGYCVAGGSYTAHPFYGPHQGFVVSEKHGHWGKAIEVPGLAALAKGGAGVDSVSCASAGNCAAGGTYEVYSDVHFTLGFVISEKHGHWGKAIEVPGLRALTQGAGTYLYSVSCGSAGNCAAGGQYADNEGRGFQGFVVSEKHGHWGKAIQVPGLAALRQGRFAWVSSVSCGSAGNCAAGGFYDDRSGHSQGFVVSEKHGHWGKAIEVPGLAALNKGGAAGVDSVSCASAAYCAAGGHYRNSGLQGFVVNRA